jgi:hypothetical protein
MAAKKTIKKKPAKKKTSSQKLSDILNIAAEELIDPDSAPFEKSESKSVVVSAPQLTNELDRVRRSNVAIATIPESTEENDFEYTRTILYKTLEKASRATDSMLAFCEEGEGARSYEVLGQLIKVTSEVAKDLYALRKTKAELNKFKLPGEVTPTTPIDITDTGRPTVILNATTAEVLDSIRQTRQNKKA